MNGTETVFTPLASTAGGLLIGLAAGLLLLFAGRVAGVSGILGGAFLGKGDRAWRFAFLGGLIIGGAALYAFAPGVFSPSPASSKAALIGAGLLVGVGTQLGSGCTSGHGICGLPRLSIRSLVAVVTFIATGALTVLAVRLLGGAS